MTRQGWVWLCGLCGVSALTVSLVLALHRPPHAEAGAAPVVNRGAVPDSSSSQLSSATTTLGHARPAPAAAVSSSAPAPTPGTRLQLPRLHVDAPLVHVAAANDVMQVPPDPRVVGWWTGGAAPGAGHGPVVIVGHINYAGVAGALSVLPDAEPGDAVVVAGAAGAVHYRVQAVHTYPKSIGLPASLFAPAGPEELELITCGGPFDPGTGNYQDNIVVFAARSS